MLLLLFLVSDDICVDGFRPRVDIVITFTCDFAICYKEFILENTLEEGNMNTKART